MWPKGRERQAFEAFTWQYSAVHRCLESPGNSLDGGGKTTAVVKDSCLGRRDLLLVGELGCYWHYYCCCCDSWCCQGVIHLYLSIYMSICLSIYSSATNFCLSIHLSIFCTFIYVNVYMYSYISLICGNNLLFRKLSSSLSHSERL